MLNLPIPAFSHLRASNVAANLLHVPDVLVGSLIAADHAPWRMRRTWFDRGDLLVITTDGLTEARDEAGRQLGDERVQDILGGLDAVDPRAVVQTLFRSAQEHGTGWQRDDITVLAAVLGHGPDR